MFAQQFLACMQLDVIRHEHTTALMQCATSSPAVFDGPVGVGEAVLDGSVGTEEAVLDGPCGVEEAVPAWGNDKICMDTCSVM